MVVFCCKTSASFENSLSALSLNKLYRLSRLCVLHIMFSFYTCIMHSLNGTIKMPLRAAAAGTSKSPLLTAHLALLAIK